MSHNKKDHNEEEALEGALSPIVNRLIDQNFEKSGDKIASQMAPLIGGAIREQIKSQKDDIVDALYPVMGNMISKFVTRSLEELLNKINQQIQNGLSIATLKRKIKAKIKGVSETELLLQESSEAHIKAVLLIHKESGSLLAKVEDENGTLSDADMLASMMSAIRSFVNEWISANESDQELGEIEYGGNKIIIEASGYSYLAVIVEGAAYIKTYEKIRQALGNLVLKYGKEIKNFQGNFTDLPQEEIQNELQKLLNHNKNTVTQEKPKKLSPLLILIPLLLFGYIAYISYKEYQDEHLKKEILNRIEHTPQLLPFRIDVQVDDGVVTLQGLLPFKYHKELLEQELKEITHIKKLKDDVQIVPTLTDPMQISSNIAYLLQGINLDPTTHINYKFDYTTVTLYGKVPTLLKKNEILSAVKKIRGVQKVEDKMQLLVPKIDIEIYFERAVSSLNTTMKDKLKHIAKIIKTNKLKQNIDLKAYSDMIGNVKKNRKLAKERLESIINFLQQEGIDNKIITQIMDTPPPGVDPKIEPDKARQIRLKLIKENNNV